MTRDQNDDMSEFPMFNSRGSVWQLETEASRKCSPNGEPVPWALTMAREGVSLPINLPVRSRSFALAEAGGRDETSGGGVNYDHA